MDSGLDGLVQLVLEADELAPGRALPLVFTHLGSLVPQDVDEVASDALNTFG